MLFSKIPSRFTLRATALLLVGFYALAASRGLIPGLCATQAALEACTNPDVAAAPVTACCASPRVPEDDDSSGDQHVPKSPCAFCHLVSTPGLSLTAPEPASFAALDGSTPIDHIAPHLALVRSPHSERGPPAGSSS